MNKPDFTPLAPFERDTLPAIYFNGLTYSSKVALSFKKDGRWLDLSHAEVNRRVVAVGAWLEAIGIEKGDRVAILSENRPEWVVVDYATLALGAIGVPIYPSLPTGQIAYITNDCTARVLFVSDAEQAQKVIDGWDSFKSLEWIISFDAVDDPNFVPMEQVLEKGTGLVQAGLNTTLKALADCVNPRDPATIIYTSGTTGSPKGVMLSHLNMTAMVAATHQHGSLHVSTGDRALSFLPLSHVFERAADYYFWDQGISITYAENARAVADNVVEVRPHGIISVPRLFEKVYSAVLAQKGLKQAIVRWAVQVAREWSQARITIQPIRPGLARRHAIADRLVYSKLRKRLGGRMKLFICGGAPLSPDVSMFFYAAGMPVYEGYGLSETSPVLAANRPTQYRFGTVGVPYPGVELKISNEGEVLARGPSLMLGYWNRPDLTEKAIDSSGWFHTGDLGSFDLDGFLRITGRIKDLIITAGGKNIAPQPVEQNASESPFVSQVVMIGDRRPYPILLVVPEWSVLASWAIQQGIDISDRIRAIQDARIVQFMEKEVLGRLQGFARFELPKKLSLIAEEFSVEMGTLTPSLKARRHVIEQLYNQLIEQTYLGEAPAQG